MDRNGNAVWHAGGTRAPLLMKRAGPAADILHPRATGVVPTSVRARRLARDQIPRHRHLHERTESKRVLSVRRALGSKLERGASSPSTVGVGASFDSLAVRVLRLILLSVGVLAGAACRAERRR